jgi:hypothetical protein
MYGLAPMGFRFLLSGILASMIGCFPGRLVLSSKSACIPSELNRLSYLLTLMLFIFNLDAISPVCFNRLRFNKNNVCMLDVSSGQ